MEMVKERVPEILLGGGLGGMGGEGKRTRQKAKGKQIWAGPERLMGLWKLNYGPRYSDPFIWPSPLPVQDGEGLITILYNITRGTGTAAAAPAAGHCC
jgi:hypothetical protein